jgi:hypothetical protein
MLVVGEFYAIGKICRGIPSKIMAIGHIFFGALSFAESGRS